MTLKRTSFFSFLLLSMLFITPHTGDGFNWQTLESGMLKVHWYEGDANFGQEALETAEAGLESMGRLLPPDLRQPIEIFIYANVNDFKSALASGREDWIAGHVDPEQGIVFVLIEPGAEQGIVMEQRIPHELMHVILFRRFGSGYTSIPGWLREGMATLAELYPNAEYDRVLKDSATGDALIPVKDLCTSFPDSTADAFLAYAESRSFTNYLYETYGSSGLVNLATVYADGVDCEHGTERAFGVSLSVLESQWRSSVSGRNPVFNGLQNIAPYLVLLCLILVIPMVGILSTLRKGNRNGPGIFTKK
jgi:hypothetical protein